MSKTIAISDDVYELLQREKGDRSFSEVIEEKVQQGGTIAEVAGQEVLASDTYESVEEDVRSMTDGTMDRLDDEAL